MPRLISFAKTVPQFLDGSKTVTRRDGWRFLTPGTILMAVDKSPRSGGEWKRLGLIEAVSVWIETLGSITADDVEREGFPYGDEDDECQVKFDFLDLYLGRPHHLEDLDREVTRIEFRRLFCWPRCGRPAMLVDDAFAGDDPWRYWCERCCAEAEVVS